MTSEAYRWLPHFARSVLFAVASRYRGFNNGGLELTVKTARAQGINKQELYAGLRLCLEAGLLRKTSPGKRRSGKGIPAKYALTWRPINDFPALNLIATEHPSDEWRSYNPSTPRPRSLTKAEKHLGIRKPKKPVKTSWPDRESIEVAEPAQTKSPFEFGPSHTKATSESDASQTTRFSHVPYEEKPTEQRYQVHSMTKDKTKNREGSKNTGKLAATLYQLPSFSMASALRVIYAEKKLSDDAEPGLDILEMKRLLESQGAAVSAGDLSRIEEMLITQAHVLQALFSAYVGKSAAVSCFDHLQCYLGLALKAQNQCRQTLSTLGELKHPKRATFITQQNNAVAQSVNPGRFNSRANQNEIDSANELMESSRYEVPKRMESGSKEETIGANPALEAVGSVDRSPDPAAGSLSRVRTPTNTD